MATGLFHEWLIDTGLFYECLTVTGISHEWLIVDFIHRLHDTAPVANFSVADPFCTSTIPWVCNVSNRKPWTPSNRDGAPFNNPSRENVVAPINVDTSNDASPPHDDRTSQVSNGSVSVSNESQGSGGGSHESRPSSRGSQASRGSHSSENRPYATVTVTTPPHYIKYDHSILP
jgi:hypothetical protein